MLLAVIVIVPSPPVAEAAPQPSVSVRSETVVFIHGIAPPTGIGTDGATYFGTMPLELEKLGWTKQVRLAFYGCDRGYDLDASQYGRHDTHNTGGYRGHTGCGAESVRDAIASFFIASTTEHNPNTPIEHIAYHVAWALWTEFTAKGECVKVVAHSMGGLVTRYALTQVMLQHPEFPPGLCISKVVTFGTPHDGAYTYTALGPYYQAQQMNGNPPDFYDFLKAHGMNPAGRDQFGNVVPTGWTVVATEGDEAVPPGSALAMNADMKVLYPTVREFVCVPGRCATIDRQKFGHGGFFGADHAAPDLAHTADIERPFYGVKFRSTTAPSPGAVADQALAFDDWACGTPSQPWPLVQGVTWSSDLQVRGVPQCHYTVPVTPSTLDVIATLDTGAISRRFYVEDNTQDEDCWLSLPVTRRECVFVNPLGTGLKMWVDVSGTRAPHELTVRQTEAACADGQDNDGDGLVDWGSDTGCGWTRDNNEANGPLTRTCTTEAPVYECYFTCAAGQRLSVEGHDSFQQSGGWPRVKATCGGQNVVCQSHVNCAATSGLTSSSGKGVCRLETTRTWGKCTAG